MNVARALALDGTAESPAATRRWARAVLDGLGYPHLVETAVLGLTELVTNSCLHARTAVTVTVRVATSGRLRFEVTDGSPVLPKQRQPGEDSTTGRGIQLISACGDWGADPSPTGDGKTVWFEPRADMAEEAS